MKSSSHFMYHPHDETTWKVDDHPDDRRVVLCSVDENGVRSELSVFLTYKERDALLGVLLESVWDKE